MNFSRNLNEFIFNHATEGVFQSTPEGRFLYVNKAMARMFGYESPDEMTSSVVDIAHQIHATPKSRETFQAALNEQEVVEGFETQNLRKDGSLLWTSTNARAVKDADGKVLYYLGFMQDITARKDAEKALGESETRYRALVEQVPAAVYIDAPTNNLNSGIYISPQIELISGYTPEEWTSTRAFWPGLIHPEDLEQFVRENERTNETGEPFNMEYRILHRSGRTVWLRDMATLTCDENNRPMYWHGILIDITEQKTFQEALHSSEERFRKVFEASPIPICITMFENGEYIDANEAYLRITGFTREQLIGRTTVELGLLSAQERADWLRIFSIEGHSLSGTRSQFRTARGEDKQTLEFYETIELGGHKAIVSMFHDMTAQVTAAEALRESEARYRALVENIPAVVFLDPADGSDNTTYISSKIESLLGYTPEEWIADPELWKKSLHPQDRERVLAADRLTDESGERFSLEYRMITRNGDTVWIQEEANLIHDDKGTPLFWQGFLLDITNRKAAQEALRQSEERFEKIFRASPLGICITTLEEGTYLDANDAYCALVEYPREQIIGNTSTALGVWESPEDRTVLIRVLNESASMRERVGRIRTGEGKFREVVSFFELVNLNDKPCILTTHFDTSRQQEAQDALRAVAASYRGLFDSVSDAIYIQDREGRFLDVNRGAVDMYGYPVEFFLGKTPEVLSAPGRNDLDALAVAIELAFQGQPQEFEFWGMRSNGEIFPKDVRVTRGVYFGDEVVFALAQDITDRKNAEEALHRREAILEAIAFASEQFLKVANWQTCVDDILERLGGAGEASRVYIFKNKSGPRGELMADQIHEWVAPGVTPQIDNVALQNFDYVKNGFTLWAETLGKGQVLSELVRNLPAPIQEEFIREQILSIMNVPITVNNRWWGFIGYDECTHERIWSQPEIEALKAAASIIGAAIERTASAEALARSEERYRTLIEQASDGIFIADINGERLDFNQSGCDMLGYTHDELLALGILDIADSVELQRKPFPFHALKPGETITSERALRRKDGSSFHAEISMKRLPNKTLQGIIRDITERRKALDAQERQLKELSVLQALASAGSSAHDEDELIEQATEIIGRTIYTDILGILLVSEDGTTFRPHPSYRGITIPGWQRDYTLDEGVTGFVVKTGQPLNLPDVQKFERYIEVNPISLSELCVPMKIGDRVIGLINAESSQFAHFTPDDERLMLTIAGQLATAIERLRAFNNQAATAMENARLFQSEQQRRQEAETLREASAVVATTLNSNEAINLILDQLARVLQYDSASVQLLRGDQLEIVGGRGWADATGVIGMRFPVPGDNPNSDVVINRKPIIIDTTRKTHYPFKHAPHDHILSWMGVPLMARGQVIGMLAVDSREENHFNNEHIRLVTAFANQAAVAIENARLYEQNEEQIQHLTALRDIDTAIASSLDLRVTLNILLEQSMSQLQPDAMDILVFNPHLQSLELAANTGFHAPTLRRQIRIGDGMAGTIAVNRRMLQIPDLTTRPEFSQMRWLQEEKFVYYAGLPLVGKGQIKGVLEAFFRSPKTPSMEWLDFLQTIAGQAAIAIDNAQLFENLQHSNQELSLAYDTTLEGWGKALELRDKETEGHTRRVAELTIQLARRMGIGETGITHLRRGVLLHDIGKMGVPDHILRKTGELSDEEWREMRLHPQYAYDLLHPIEYLRPALDIPYCHHEKWDGTGYPRGLRGTEIPLPARIFAVVDVWDALLSDRPYRPAWTRQQTIDYIQRESGTRFDPHVVQAFMIMISTME